MYEFRASARYQRCSPRRMRFVAELVRRKNVLVAMNILTGLKQAGAALLLKVVKSARANAIKMDEEKKLSINPDRLVIVDLQVGGGPIMKRSRPMSMGRSGRIRKRTTHVTVVLADPLGGMPGATGREK